MVVMENLARRSGSWQLPGRRYNTLPISRSDDARHQAILLEVDVTAARREIRFRNRGSEDSVSFLAWVVASVAGSLCETSPCPDTPQKDVTVLLPRRVGSEIAIVPLLVDHANRQSVASIAALLHAARVRPLEPAEFVVRRNSGLRHWLFNHSPELIRHSRVRRAIGRHRELGPLAGDAVISVAGLGGRARGWFIPTSGNPICVGIGAVTPKGLVINGAIHQRDVFHLAVVIDTQAIAADTASRWITSLLRLMESARELNLN